MLLCTHSGPVTLLRHEWSPLNLPEAGLAFCLSPLLGAGPGPEMGSAWGITPAVISTIEAGARRWLQPLSTSGRGYVDSGPMHWLGLSTGSVPAPVLLWFPRLGGGHRSQETMSSWQGLAQSPLLTPARPCVWEGWRAVPVSWGAALGLDRPA